MKPCIAENSTIRWRYCLIADGKTFEENEDPQGDILHLGQDEVHANIESILIGLPKGELARYVITPDQAFGYPDEAAIQRVPRDTFPADFAIAEGNVISFTLPSGEAIPGHIMAIQDDGVKVDFNHPLAGHTITLELEIIDILDIPDEQ